MHTIQLIFSMHNDGFRLGSVQCTNEVGNVITSDSVINPITIHPLYLNQMDLIDVRENLIDV